MQRQALLRDCDKPWTDTNQLPVVALHEWCDPSVSSANDYTLGGKPSKKFDSRMDAQARTLRDDSQPAPSQASAVPRCR